MVPLLVFLVLLTNKLDNTVKISYFAATSPLFLTFFTLLITSFGSRGGETGVYSVLVVAYSVILNLLCCGVNNFFWAKGILAVVILGNI